VLVLMLRHDPKLERAPQSRVIPAE
jgi:hypothetical protein